MAASLLAMVVGTGGHWMVLQSVAWARMIADRAVSEPLAAAISKSLDGKHPCSMCHQIREGREREVGEGSEASLVQSARQPTQPWLASARFLLALPPSRTVPVATANDPLRPLFEPAPPDPPPRTA